MDKIPPSTEPLTPLQKAAYALKEMRAQLDTLQRAQQEPIAIIGMSGRFPNATNCEEFWQLLHNQVDAVTEIPSERWSINDYYDSNPNAPGKMNIRHGGFLTKVEEFDPLFFGISKREAIKLDPQHRLLLEVSWEALEHAGQSPKALMNSQTGNFIGIDQNDYGLWQLAGDPKLFDVYSTTTNGFCFASGRLSYTLGLQGPTMPVDTACSSSLVALHLACQSLRAQECQLALVGGVNLLLSPEFLLVLTKTQSLSPSGRCRTFDQTADGYILGEGCGVIVLKRLTDALANKDNILATILASGVNHGGASGGITVPNEMAEEMLIRQVLDRAKIKPTQVQFIETHGTGTTLGDPIEVNAISTIFKERAKDDPLILGAVKTNLGHLNAAAGIAGLIKTILALQHEEIPPNLHFNTPNPHIDWEKCPLKIPTVPIPWKRGEKQRIAGVSSFGISGTNAHVILAEPPLPENNQTVTSTERPLQILTLSARCDKALRDLAQRYENYIKSPSNASLANICFTANTGRSHFNHRLAIVTSSKTQLQTQLQAFIQGKLTTSVWHGELPLQNKALPLKVEPLIANKNELTEKYWQELLNDLAQKYVQGADINWENLDKNYPRQRQPLPTYPFQRQRYWLKDEPMAKLANSAILENASNSTPNEKNSPILENSANFNSTKPLPENSLTTPKSANSQSTTLWSESSSILKETSIANLTQQLSKHFENQPVNQVSNNIAHILAQQLETASKTLAQVVADQLTHLRQTSVKKIITQTTSPPTVAQLSPTITFLFPGVGDHYVNMARGLYNTESVFRQHIDQCCDLLLPYLQQDLREIIYPLTESAISQANKPQFDLKKMLGRQEVDENSQKLNKTIFSQPAVFIIEYALAQLWLSRGVRPNAMFGYSIGEYTAACLAGVISLEDSLKLLITRAQLIQELPNGSLLAIPLSEEKIRPFLNANLSIAIISTPTQCVIGGTTTAISELENQLREQQVLSRRLPTTHAFHSHLLEPLKNPLVTLIKQFNLQPPKIPYLSNVTGTWITAAQATNPEYWAQHTYSTVRFADGIRELLRQSPQIFLEVGPGQSLGSFIYQHPAFAEVQNSIKILPSLRTRYDKQADETLFLNTLSKFSFSNEVF